MNSRHRQVTQEQVLNAIAEIECTPRWRDYRIDPQNLAVPMRPERVMEENYRLLFEEPYLDPAAFRRNPMPEFMITAYKRLTFLLLSYAYAAHNRPDSSQTQYVLSVFRQTELKHSGYEVWTTPVIPEYESECLAVRTTYGVFFAPLTWAQALDPTNLWSHPALM